MKRLRIRIVGGSLAGLLAGLLAGRRNVHGTEKTDNTDWSVFPTTFSEER